MGESFTLDKQKDIIDKCPSQNLKDALEEIYKLKGMKLYADASWPSSSKKVWKIRLSDENLQCIIDKFGGPNKKVTNKHLTYSKSSLEIKRPWSEYKTKDSFNIRFERTGKTGSSNLKISTDEQEQIALEIFKHKISGNQCKWNSFDEMWSDKKSGLKNIYKKGDIKQLKEWYKHFVLIFDKIDRLSDVPSGKYKVFSQSDGFMEWVSKKVREGYGISKKDSWNPADVWLIKDATIQKKYEKRIDNLVQENKKTKNVEYISMLNDVLREAYHKRDIVGISLKKNNGKVLYFEESNLNRNTQKHEVPGVEFIEVNLNLSFEPDKKNKIESFSKTCTVVVKEIGKLKYKFAIKSNTGKVGNITYEFLKFSGATTMEGKVPKDLLQGLLKEKSFRMPSHTDYSSFDAGNWNHKLNEIKSGLKMDNKSLITNAKQKEFLTTLKSTWVGKNKPTDINYAIMQIVDFLYILAKIKNLNMFLTKLLYMSQKKNMVGQDRYGPFGKLS